MTASLRGLKYRRTVPAPDRGRLKQEGIKVRTQKGDHKSTGRPE